jgi:hypothetical protein
MTDYAKLYGDIHQSQKRFPGFSIKAYLNAITDLVAAHQPVAMLDYGSGKGRQYSERRYHDAWGILPTCYDIGVPEFAAKPIGQFGGVICTDMLEHIDKPDVPVMLDELIRYVELGGFLFLGISCRPTRKKLPDGRDVHLTIEPPQWWIAQIIESANRVCGEPFDKMDAHIVAHWDVDGHFDCDETPWDSWA